LKDKIKVSMNKVSPQVGKGMTGNHRKQGNWNQGNSPIYCCFVCNSLEKEIYDYPRRSITQKMFQDKASHVKLKKDKVVVNMVLIVEIRSQNVRLML
jgi:hypothetical protein